METKNDRQSNVNSTDKRVKKTQRLLRESLFKLLSEKPLNQITVRELTELAEVNRSTFYFYFENIEDMLEQIQGEIYRLFSTEVINDSDNLSESSEFADYTLKFVKFVYANHDICEFLWKNDINNKLRERIMNDVREHLPDSTLIFPLNDPRRYLTDYAMAAIIETIIDWMDDGMKVPPKELAEFMCNTYFRGRQSFIPIK